MHRPAALLAALAVALACTAGASAGLRLHRVAGDFEKLTYVTSAPGDRHDLFVVEQRGVVWRLHHGNRSIFLDLRDRVGSVGEEQGLLSIAFHPAQKRRMFADYTNKNGDTRVVEFRTNRDRTRAFRGSAHVWSRIDQPYANHNGGQLQFGLNGVLYVSTGDGGDGGDPGDRAQNPRSRLGKLLSLRVDRKGARPHVAALGFRNPWRFSVDRRTGVFWIGDVGQGSWEEIDRFRTGTERLDNYGWNVWEGRHHYSDPNSADNELGPGKLRWPVAEYSHDAGRCSVTGGYMLRGAVPGHGRYFYGDYCSGDVWSFRWKDGRRSGYRAEPFDVPWLTSFGVDGRGRLLLASQTGTVDRLVRR